MEQDQENLNEVLKSLAGQNIKSFTVKEGVDNHFHLVTDKIDLKFAANDLGVWIEEIKELD